MAFDLRQVMAAFLTFSMFVMLGNMIKRDHIDPLLEPLEVSQNVQYDTLKISKQSMMKLKDLDYGPWRVKTDPVKPCWKKPLSKGKQKPNNGYIFFSLTNGPEFHASQIANAVAVAQHLGATLAIPDIRGAKLDDKRQFGEIYDVNKFITSLDGIVKVDKTPPAEISSNKKLHTIRVPNRVSENFIASKIEPVFKSQRNLKIVTYFNGSSSTKQYHKSSLSSISNGHECLAMYETLKLQTDLQELVDSMIGTLRSLSSKTRGRFVVVDLRDDLFEKNACQEKAEDKTCYNAKEIGEFLTKIGFHSDTTIYVTQTGWSSNLNPLRDIFPNTFTKDAIIPADEKAKFMDMESGENEKFIDFYMSVQGDIFVPAFRGGRFYGSVVGKRIANGNTQIFVPSKNASSESADDYISPYVSKKSHVAYSCFC